MIWEHMEFNLRDKRKMGWGNVPPSSRRSPGTRPGRRCRRTSGTPCCSWRCCSQHRQAHRHLGNCARVLVNDTPVLTSTNYPNPVVTENACLRKERKIQIVSSSSDECNHPSNPIRTGESEKGRCSSRSPRWWGLRACPRRSCSPRR